MPRFFDRINFFHGRLCSTKEPQSTNYKSSKPILKINANSFRYYYLQILILQPNYLLAEIQMEVKFVVDPTIRYHPTESFSIINADFQSNVTNFMHPANI
jgi:hypothetical protein